MHLGLVHPRLEARGRPFPRSSRSPSRVNLPVLRPLTRGPQGQPSPLRTPHGRPGAQGIFPTSRGQAPHGWPMVHHSRATAFCIPRGCCLAPSASRPIPCPVTLCHILSPAQPRVPWFPDPQGPLCDPCHTSVLAPSPHPIPHLVFITHRATSNPVARAHRILIHPGTVLCSCSGVPARPQPRNKKEALCSCAQAQVDHVGCPTCMTQGADHTHSSTPEQGMGDTAERRTLGHEWRGTNIRRANCHSRSAR